MFISDSVINFKFQPEDVLNALDINYSAVMNKDFLNADGEAVNQSVTYYQGKWKNGNLIENNANLCDIKLKIDSLIDSFD